MPTPSRYDVDEKSAGLEGDILKNKLGITDQKTLSDTETVLLSDAYFYFLRELEKNDFVFDVDLIFKIHKYFLGTLYSWAGEVRKINISKDNSFFIPAQYLSKALAELDKIIIKNLPRPKDKKSELANKLAEIVCEFNAIHPFREGNGRVIRLFVDLLLVRNNYKMFDYSKISTKKYILACVAGMKKDYDKMTDIFKMGLKNK
ncbi:MAG: Fic family protein [Candidatus Magasanikbacteria bacterium]|jgi:cell filamentation protein